MSLDGRSFKFTVASNVIETYSIRILLFVYCTVYVYKYIFIYICIYIYLPSISDLLTNVQMELPIQINQVYLRLGSDGPRTKTGSFVSFLLRPPPEAALPVFYNQYISVFFIYVYSRIQIVALLYMLCNLCIVELCIYCNYKPIMCHKSPVYFCYLMVLNRFNCTFTDISHTYMMTVVGTVQGTWKNSHSKFKNMDEAANVPITRVIVYLLLGYWTHRSRCRYTSCM
jgi:hypothetical protein